jgi:hypothetical protein
MAQAAVPISPRSQSRRERCPFNGLGVMVSRTICIGAELYWNFPFKSRLKCVRGCCWRECPLDLSLREVIPPLLVLTLDQGEYDVLDKVAAGLLTVAGHMHPAQIRVSLNSISREAVETIAVPFASQFAKSSDSGRLTLMMPADLSRCRFEFNAAALAPGSYECRVALLDAEQREIAQRSVPFERTQDAK